MEADWPDFELATTNAYNRTELSRRAGVIDLGHADGGHWRGDHSAKSVRPQPTPSPRAHP